MMYYAPKVLQAAGFATEDAIVLDVLTGLASVIGSALGLWLLARFSRRRVIIGGTIGLTVMLWAMTAVFLLGINPHLDDSGNVTSGMPPLVPLPRGDRHRRLHALHAGRQRPGHVGHHV